MNAEDDKVLRRAALKAGKIVDKGRLGSDTMRDAAKIEASALYESEDTYNYPEEAMAKAFERGVAWQAAQSQPAPPVPSSVQEIMELMMPYVRACVDAQTTPIDKADYKPGEVTAAFAPLEAALTALVEKNHELQFSLDGVNAMRRPLTEGHVRGIWRAVGEGWLADGKNPYLEYARAIEKAHGIEPEQGDGGVV